MKAWEVASSSDTPRPSWCLLSIIRLRKEPGCTPRAFLRPSVALASMFTAGAAAAFRPASSRQCLGICHCYHETGSTDTAEKAQHAKRCHESQSALAKRGSPMQAFSDKAQPVTQIKL